jgi:hypothetical protein
LGLFVVDVKYSGTMSQPRRVRTVTGIAAPVWRDDSTIYGFSRQDDGWLSLRSVDVSSGGRCGCDKARRLRQRLWIRRCRYSKCRRSHALLRDFLLERSLANAYLGHPQAQQAPLKPSSCRCERQTRKCATLDQDELLEVTSGNGYEFRRTQAQRTSTNRVRRGIGRTRGLWPGCAD